MVMNEKEKQQYKKNRELEIESIALKKAAKILGIDESLFVWLQQDNVARKALYNKVGITFSKTPDFAITNGSEKQANQLLLVEVNEPTGGLVRDYGVGAEIAQSMRTAPLSNGMDGNVNRVIINKPNTNFDKEVINKLKKTYQKYSFERSESYPISVNTGLIFCMGDDQNEATKLPGRNPFYFNLSHAQFMPLVINTVYELSGGKLNSRDAIPSRGKVLSFEFCDAYKFMGFVMLIGGDSTVNYNYLFVNKRFLRANSCFLAKKLKLMKELNEC
jgi:hypothetical protein